MAFKNKLYTIHFYGRMRGKCDGRLQNWPGIVNERPKFLAMCCDVHSTVVFCDVHCIGASCHAMVQLSVV